MYSLFRAASLAILTTSIQSSGFADQKALRQVLLLGSTTFNGGGLKFFNFDISNNKFLQKWAISSSCTTVATLYQTHAD
jgi:hypothetical protein